MRKNEKITALYERLSRDDFGKDDDQQRESNSISNQKAMLEEFAARQGFTNIVHFTDDGISGTCFDRPGFLAMMKEVEAGNVEYLCIKDMSRMGRDYRTASIFLSLSESVHGYSKKFREEHEEEILLHQAAKNAFDEMGVKKLPKVKELQTEYAKLLEEKKKTYAEYRRSREEMRELLTAKANVDRVLKMEVEQDVEKEKDHGQR